nr:polysaccharide biosynthesis tyrosine autokinase [Afifella sp. IM 167]
MAALLGQLASAERKLSALTSSGASKSEQIPQLQQEIADLHRQIAQGADVLVQSLDNEAAIARQKRDLLAGGLSAARSRLAKADRQTVKLAQLKREADVNRGVYESYLQRYKQAIEQQGVVTPEARLISSAEGDPTRVSPRLSNWLALGLALGVVFGLAGAVAQEFTASPSRTRERFQKLTGLAVLSELPRWRAIDSPEAAHAAQDSTHPLGRALGMLAAGLSPLRAKTRSLVLAFTAAGSREGITTAALASARYLAVSGLSVVLVDANLRRPDVARRLGVAPQRFLDEILKGADPTALLLKDPLSEARIIPARQGAVAPELLFQSKRFLAVVDDLRRHFDVVLIDTPDLASASDALHFAAAADHSVLIVHPQRNRPADTLAALAGLSAVGRTPLGLIINAIPMGRISGAWARSRAAGTPGDGQHRHGSFGGQVEASLNS